MESVNADVFNGVKVFKESGILIATEGIREFYLCKFSLIAKVTKTLCVPTDIVVNNLNLYHSEYTDVSTINICIKDELNVTQLDGEYELTAIGNRQFYCQFPHTFLVKKRHYLSFFIPANIDNCYMCVQKASIVLEKI